MARSYKFCILIAALFLVHLTASWALAVPPEVEISPENIVIQPFDFSFTISDQDGLSDLDANSLVFEVNGIDFGDLIAAEILTVSQRANPPISITPVGNTGVRVTFASINLRDGSLTEIRIAIRDGSGATGQASVTYLAPPPSPFVSTEVEGVSVSGNTVQDIELPRGIDLAGQVTTASGIPVPGVSLTALDVGQNQSFSAATDINGIYRFALPRGRFELRLRPLFGDEFLLDTIDLTSDTRRDAQLSDIFLLSGTVRDRAGEPIDSGSVNASGVNDTRASGSSPIDRNGSYRIFLPGGAYNVTARTPVGFQAPTPQPAPTSGFELGARFGPLPPPPPTFDVPTTVRAVEITADTQVDITVPDIFIISGKIRDSRNEPVQNASVQVLNEAIDFTASSTSDNEGRYSAPVPAGTYTFTVTPPFQQVVPPQVGIRLPQTVLSPTATIVPGVEINQDTVRDIVLADGLFLSGRVTDSEGAPVAGALVTANEPDLGFNGSSSTNSDGIYLIVLPQGRYNLRASPGGGFPIFFSPPVVLGLPAPSF